MNSLLNRSGTGLIIVPRQLANMICSGGGDSCVERRNVWEALSEVYPAMGSAVTKYFAG